MTKSNFQEDGRTPRKKEYQRKETIIIPGIDHGVIPSQILPQDMAGVMTRFYEKLFPPDNRKKRLLHIAGIVLFLIIICGLPAFAAIINTILHSLFYLRCGTVS